MHKCNVMVHVLWSQNQRNYFRFASNRNNIQMQHYSQFCLLILRSSYFSVSWSILVNSLRANIDWQTKSSPVVINFILRRCIHQTKRPGGDSFQKIRQLKIHFTRFVLTAHCQSGLTFVTFFSSYKLNQRFNQLLLTFWSQTFQRFWQKIFN